MNSNPSAQQKIFHTHLREMGCIVSGAYLVEIHHIFGSKWKVKGFVKAGEWLVMPLQHEIHQDIKSYSWDEERQMWLDTLDKHEFLYDYQPVPEGLIEYVKDMKNRHDVLRGFYE